MFQAKFGVVTVTGAKGLSAQQGETSLDSRMDAEKEDTQIKLTPICKPQEQEQVGLEKGSIKKLTKSLMLYAKQFSQKKTS